MLAAPARHMARAAHCGAAHAALARAHVAALYAPLTQPQQGGFFLYVNQNVGVSAYTTYIYAVRIETQAQLQPGIETYNCQVISLSYHENYKK